MPKLSNRSEGRRKPSVVPTIYTASLSDRIETGTAREIFENIRAHANPNSSVSKLTPEENAKGMVREARLMVPTNRLKFLQSQRYASVYEEALEYLSATPGSSILILARHAAVAETAVAG